MRSAPRVSPSQSITASALATSLLPRPQALESFRRPSILQALDLPAFKTSSTLEDKPPLPAIGLDISRPSSTSTVASYTQQRHGSHASIQLPALSTLASVASTSPPANKESNEGKESKENNGNGTPSGGTPRKMPSPPPPRYVVLSFWQRVGGPPELALALSEVLAHAYSNFSTSPSR